MRQARVHLVMGSKSDKDVVKASGMVNILAEVLGEDDIYVEIISAHRNLRKLLPYVDEACQSGAQIFIGVAGLAAALPGALAGANGMLKPVVAAPLDRYGVDPCIAMPPGVPLGMAGLGVVGGAYEVGKPPVSMDKQYVRDWATSTGWNKQPPAPALPDEVVAKTRVLYGDVAKRLTGSNPLT